MSAEMSRALAESVIKKIISEIVQESAVRGHMVSDTLVAFMVKAVVLDPRNGFNVDRTLTKEDVQKLEELCLDKLTEKCSPTLDTIKMQVCFDMSYTSRCEFLDEIHRALESSLSAASREITDSRAKTREELDALYHRIITYIQLRSGMGSPADHDDVQETAAALQSVFPQTELGAFMVLLKHDKEQQLRELTMIVTGIRLFNRAGKGTDLRDLKPALLSEALPVISNIEKELSASQTLAWKYTALQELPAGERNVPAAPLRQALYNIRQHAVFLQMLLCDARACTEQVETLQTEMMSLMQLLKETVQTRRAVATAKVFPMFKSMSRLWYGLQDEAELLNIVSNILHSLRPFIASQAEIFSEAYLDGLLKGAEVKTDERRMAESSNERIVPAEMEPQEWFLPETVASFNELPLQYNGACGATLVSRDGLLLPGNPHIGILKHREKLYVFSSKEAALKFASSPDDFIGEVAEQAKRSPELIQLLRLHQEFSCVGPYTELDQGEIYLVKPVTRCESGTQTDIHPVESNIVRSYEWNEWELRRKAIKLTDLRTKLTHSMQTNMSHMRRENITQTWLPKTVGTQSKRESASGVPKPQVFVAGLRGQRDGKVVKTNLTRPVEED